MEFSPLEIAYFALKVPSSASKGSVSPISFLNSETAFSYFITAATIELLLMYSVKSLKKGLSL